MNTVVTDEKLSQYFAITHEALEAARESEKGDEEQAKDFLDMASRYYQDAEHFKNQGDYVLAFAALNYAKART